LHLLVPELRPYQPISTEGLVYGFDTNPLGVEPVINESKGERWKPKEARERYFYISDYGEILGADWFNDYLDRTRHLICNCFETKEAAQEAADKIKQLLKTQQ